MPRNKKNKAVRNFYIGIDNGVSGTIGIIGPESTHFILPKQFTKKEQDYTKKKKNVTRIDQNKLDNILTELVCLQKPTKVFIMIERPMINGGKFQASVSAARALESVLILLESYRWPFVYIASTEWQRPLLPKGTKGNAQLKKASMDVASRLFPVHIEDIKKHKDGDGLLIAEHCRRFFK